MKTFVIIVQYLFLKQQAENNTRLLMLPFFTKEMNH